MADIDRWKTSLRYGAVLVIVFLGALSMHMERVDGWGFFIACFVVGSLGGLCFVWAKKRAPLYWSRLSKSRRVTLAAAGIAVALAVAFLANPHKPAQDFAEAAGYAIVALVLWGLYRIFSRVVDAFHARSDR